MVLPKVISVSPETPSIVFALKELPEFNFRTFSQKPSMVPSDRSLPKESALAVSSIFLVKRREHGFIELNSS